MYPQWKPKSSKKNNPINKKVTNLTKLYKKFLRFEGRPNHQIPLYLTTILKKFHKTFNKKKVKKNHLNLNFKNNQFDN